MAKATRLHFAPQFAQQRLCVPVVDGVAALAKLAEAPPGLGLKTDESSDGAPPLGQP